MAEAEREKALGAGVRGRSRSSSGRAPSCAWVTTSGMQIESIPTRRPLLGPGSRTIGGIPRGRIVEDRSVRSPPASPTLALHVVAEAQRSGGVCAYIDAEHAMDPVTPGLGVQRRRPPVLPAGHRRAGARDRRQPDPLGGSMWSPSTPSPP